MIFLILFHLVSTTPTYAQQPGRAYNPPPRPEAAPAPVANDEPMTGSVLPTDSMDKMLTAELIESLRDPFKVPAVAMTKTAKKGELETYNLADFRLTGVMTGPRKTRAIVVGPNGKTYMVSQSERIGMKSGKIIQIRPDALVVQETNMNAMGQEEKENLELRIDGKLISQDDDEEVSKQ